MSIIMFGKKKTVKQDDIPPVAFMDLFRFATLKDKLVLCLGLLFAATNGAIYPLTTVVFGQIINTFAAWAIRESPGIPASKKITIDQFMTDIGDATLYFVYLGIATLVLTYLYMGIFVSMGETITHRIRDHYLRSVLRQDIGWFDKEGAGQVTTRISSDTLLIQDGISEKVPLCLSQVCTVISGFVIAFIKSWKLSLVLITIFPLIAFAAAVTGVVSSRFQTKILDLYAKAGSYAEESIASVRTVVAFGGQTKMAARYKSELYGARKMGIKKSTVAGLGIGSLMFIIYLGYSLAFWYGAQLLNNNETTSGDVVNVFFAILIGAFSLGNIAPDLEAFNFAKSAAAKIYSTIDRVPPIDAASPLGETVPSEAIKGRIQIVDAKFTYPGRSEVQVLKGVSMDIEPGKTVALVGPSGSGKSTIIQLLERFYDCDEGKVLFEGKDIKELNLKWYRRQIGYVAQEPVLFEGNIFQNIVNGLVGSEWENEDDAKKKQLVEDACIKANAHDFITKLPHGYQTQVGERGLLLSGGQKQRIAIARAIVKDPVVLLLDEATSALDTTSERIVQAALDRAAEGRTTVTIAHRLSTIRNADLIIVMANGCILEQGTHKELVDRPYSAYKKLVEAQQLQNENENPLDEKDETEFVAETKKVDSVALVNTTPDSVFDIETAAEKPRQSMMSVFRKVFKLNYPELKFLIPGLFFAIAAGMVYPFFAIVFGKIVQVFQEKGDKLTEGSNFWAVMFIVLAIATFIANSAMNAFFGYAAEFMTERIRGLTFAAILRHDISFFDAKDNTTGVLTANLSSDATKIQGISGITLGSILTVVVNLVGGSIVSLIYGWKLALVAIACIPALVFSGYFRLRIITFFSEKAKGSYERSSQVACEAVSAIRTVQSLTREEDVMKHYDKILEIPLQDGFKNAWLNTLMYAVSSGISFLVNAIVFWYGGWLIAHDGYTTDQMFTVFIACVFGSMGAGRIFMSLPQSSKAQEAAENILKLLGYEPKIDYLATTGESISKDDLEGHVQFKDVKFQYPSRPHVPVLRGLNLEAKPGQFVALVGPSGCGKSTSVGLVERFYEPTSGSILIDGKNISTTNVSSYRSSIGLVSQEPNLFDMTIKENIAFGMPEIPTQEQIEKAAKDANIHDFIASLPKGYDTPVGGKGSQLSGGQKQRIAIARALIRNPRILLLDEATSALDAESERVVQEALNNAAKGRTTIAIAHRLSTIQHADLIYVFKDGVVHESGTHQELVAKRDLYYELVQEQDLSKSS